MNRRQRLEAVFRNREPRTPAWVISGVGVTLAALSLWYLTAVRTFYFREGLSGTTVLELIEITLLGGFSLVLVYAGYWLASSKLGTQRLWWTGLWTLIGLTGIVAVVAFANSLQLVRGQGLTASVFVQTMLLAAGSGSVAGLLIGISTVRESVEAERVTRQRDTLLFINELLRHNVLNGMQVIKGNAELLEPHVDDDGRAYLETTQNRSDTIVELIWNVRVLVDSLSRESSLYATDLEQMCSNALASMRHTYPHAEFDSDIPDGVEVRADELLRSVFENVLSNAIEHSDAAVPQVTLTAERAHGRVLVRIADNGPGIPIDRRETCFDPGEQDETSVGQGLGQYLVRTLVDRYGGDVWVEESEPRGAVVVMELDSA